MNWGELKAAVQQYLENSETTFVANFQLYARLAEEDIYRQAQLQSAKNLVTTTMVPDDSYVNLPIGALSIYSLAIIDPVTSLSVMLLPKDFAYLREAYSDFSVRGMPRFYAYRDDLSLLVAPTPDAAYEAEMHIFQQPASIGENDDDENTNWLSEHGENALLFGILYHGYINEKGDQDVIQAYKTQFDKGVQDLKVIAEGRQRTNSYRMPV